MGLELIIIFALLLLNGFFAMAELAIVSARKAKLRAMARRSAGARAALELAEHPTRFLSTVQIGITAIGVLTGAFGGATIAETLGPVFDALPGLAGYGEALAVAAVVLGITFLSLILGELVPKRVALASPERIAAAVSRPMRLLARVASPVVTLLSATSSLVIRLLGLKAESAAAVTEEEIRHLVHEGAETGAILTLERDMVNRVFRLGDKLVDEVMTPRTQIVWLDATAPLEENLARMRAANYSRYPVTRGDSDETVGIVRAKDLVVSLKPGAALDLFAVMRPALFVPDTTPALNMLEQFRDANLHMALVVDEYGDVKGLVTPTDILEAIVGEIAATPGGGQPSIIERGDGSLLVDAQMAADELMVRLSLAEAPPGGDDDYATVAGLMLARFEHIPREGEWFEWQGYRFEVVDMDGRRIDKVLVSRVEPAPEGAAP